MNTSYQQILIVGNGIAGMTAGDTLRRHGYTGKITIVGEEPHATYSRPALSKSALAPEADLETITLPAAEHQGREILGRRAVSLDPEGHTVTLDDGTELNYDGLIIATGAHARRFTDSPREFSLRSRDDALALRARLTENPGTTVTVIGGGPLGMEVASGAIDLGCTVTLVHPGAPLEVHIGPLLAGILTEAAREKGLTLIDSMVESVRETQDGMEVSLQDSSRLESDIVVSAAGDVPADSWLRESGLLQEGRLVVDDRCRVTDDIVAAGDISWHNTDGGLKRSPVWTAAIDQAKTAAGALLLGEDQPPLDHQPYFWTDQWGLSLKISGPAPRTASDPVVVKGDVSERSAVLHWPDHQCAAVLNMRMAVPRLHKLARSVAVTP